MWCRCRYAYASSSHDDARTAASRYDARETATHARLHAWAPAPRWSCTTPSRAATPHPLSLSRPHASWWLFQGRACRVIGRYTSDSGVAIIHAELCFILIVIVYSCGFINLGSDSSYCSTVFVNLYSNYRYEILALNSFTGSHL